jgi:hypothetical protein
MATKVFGNFTHEWKLDLPWHMVDLRDWFYMVNVGFIEPVIFLHVRVFGIRSLWEYRTSPNSQRSPTLREAVEAGKICPSCGGIGFITLYDNSVGKCYRCNSTGQI